jgi:DNA replication protein DnaC
MNALKERARQLKLHAVVENWDEYSGAEWLAPLIAAEEQERARRAADTRIRDARIGHFKPISEFDWQWPDKVDREQIEELFSLDFLKDRSNVVIVGTNGLGKTMIAQNLANTAVSKGIRTKFIKTSEMLNELVQCDGSSSRRNILKKYCKYPLLVLDEVGYLAYDNRFADLLYEVISGRYEAHSTIVTANKAFGQWQEIFPHAACAVTLIDRLAHKADIVYLEGDSFRAKEAEERKAIKAKARQAARKKKTAE